MAMGGKQESVAMLESAHFFSNKSLGTVPRDLH